MCQGEATGVEDRNVVLSRGVSGVVSRDSGISAGLSSALGSEPKAARRRVRNNWSQACFTDSC